MVNNIWADCIYEMSKFFIKFMYDMGVFFVYATVILIGIQMNFIPDMLGGFFILAILLMKLGVYDLAFNNWRQIK